MQHEIETRRERSREEVARRAYQLWEAAGRPVGQDVEHWLQAEAELFKTNEARQADLGASASKLARANAPAKRLSTPSAVISRKNGSTGSAELLEGRIHRAVSSRIR